MPLLTDLKSTTGYLTGVPTKPIMFPKDTVVPYYASGGTSSITNWTSYAGTTVNKYVCSTTNASLVNTTTSDTLATASVTLGTAGAHTGTVPYTSCGAFTTGSNLNNSVNNSAGNHSHFGSMSFSGLYPNRYNVALIRSTVETPILPANTIAFRYLNYGSYGTRLTSSGYIYNGGVAGTFTLGVTSANGVGGTSQSGTHFHHQNVMKYYITGKLTNYFGVASGTHSHSISANFSQTIMGTTIDLDSWLGSSTRPVVSEVIVMYAGDPAALPEGWYICNGSNNTMNLNGMYTRMSNQGWGNVSYSNGSLGAVTIGDIGSHSHIGTTNPAGAGNTLWHGVQAWSHTHTPSNTKTDYELGKVFLYFIQYKG